MLNFIVGSYEDFVAAHVLFEFEVFAFYRLVQPLITHYVNAVSQNVELRVKSDFVRKLIVVSIDALLLPHVNFFFAKHDKSLPSLILASSFVFELTRLG